MHLWFKLLGACCVFTAGAALGLRKARTYTRRSEMLREMTDFIRYLETNLRYRRDETCHLLVQAQTACRCSALPFALAPVNPAQLPAALRASLARLEQETCNILPADALRVFSDALLHLGTAQAEEETKQLAYAAELLEQAHTAARAEAAVQCKLYRALGLTGGAAAAVLLL